jgi:type IV pilus assembly protein PilY1
MKSTVGILPTPTILSSGPLEYKYGSGTTGDISTTVESPGNDDRGRIAWRQLQ